jgi:hypothetical protein
MTKTIIPRTADLENSTLLLQVTEREPDVVVRALKPKPTI